MRIVVALGGNALLPRGAPMSFARQRESVRRACDAIAAISPGNELVVTHGNGPQVGLLAQEAAEAGSDVTLDVLDAETAGMIGYLLELELDNRLPRDRSAVTVLTRTVVDPRDPAFTEPTKFVGSSYDDEQVPPLMETYGWKFARDGGRLRRVVPSPAPRAVTQVDAVRRLLAGGHVAICGGGGGIPVARVNDHWRGVEAVVDKDAVSALIATAINADLLIIATDVDGVYEDWGAEDARRLDTLDADELDLATFPAGSMRPKVEAAATFARTGGTAVIGAMTDLAAMVDGHAGTRVAKPSTVVVAAAS